jgi:hypothetical protein
VELPGVRLVGPSLLHNQTMPDQGYGFHTAVHVWHAELPEVKALLCAVDPLCVGFTREGVLLRDIHGRQVGRGHKSYVKHASLELARAGVPRRGSEQ